MANHINAEKAARQAKTRTLINASRMSRIKTFIKKVEVLLTQKADQPSLKTALVAAEREIMRGATKGTLHKNTASRKVSRLTKKAAQSAS
ncbi:MAG TPA: 30S ribosomal protein S20 [Alphaproteobacteria bacterium]|nr:30S ribosomal protein S20 [Alphaproteobacteria bacterium]